MEEVKKVALELLPLCKQYDAVMIIDDHVELAKEVVKEAASLSSDVKLIVGVPFTHLTSVAAALEAYAADPNAALPVQVKMIPPKDLGGWF